MNTVTTRYGVMEIIENDSTISRALRMYGEWAQEELDLLRRFIVPGACVLDAGAFIGTHTLAFAQMAGPEGTVYAFEPRREIFKVLRRNIEANGLGQVRACNVALGRQPAELAMEALDLLHADNFGGLALPLPREATGEATYFVSVVTLDGLALPPVDLVKLDVEGMEGEVLAGARDIIARDRPVIFAECNSLDGGAALLDFTRANGYRAFGSVSAAYNAANFNSGLENIFGPAKELGLLLLPGERIEIYQPVLEDIRLPEVRTFDDLACLLLSKPQYYAEVLAPFCTSHGVQLALASPDLAAALTEATELALARLDEIAALTVRVQAENAALHEAQQLAFERLDEIAALTVRIQAESAALHEAQQLAFERRDEITTLQGQLDTARQALRALKQAWPVRILRKAGLLK